MRVPHTLTCSICTLSEMRAQYLPSHVSYLNDPDVHRHLRIKPPFTLAQQERWLTATIASESDIVFAILVPDTRCGDLRFVGVTGLHEIDRDTHSARTGTVIGDTSVWGRGIATEAKRLKLAFAFDVLGLRLIRSSVSETNRASRRFLEKSGYCMTGRQDRPSREQGARVTEITFELTYASWRELNRR